MLTTDLASLPELFQAYYETTMHYEYYQEYYNVPTHEQRPMWKVGDAWRARGGKPHIIITATFGVNPRETKERILRGEVLAILAAIRTRLFRSDMREHLVIPVSVPTCRIMGYCFRV